MRMFKNIKNILTGFTTSKALKSEPNQSRNNESALRDAPQRVAEIILVKGYGTRYKIRSLSQNRFDVRNLSRAKVD
jgi:hypothetical protein